MVMTTTDILYNYGSLSVFARPLHTVYENCLAVDLPRVL